MRALGPFSVSAIGLGCMSLSHAYGTPPSREQAERVLLAALDAGFTLFDTAALYGFGANETLLGQVLKSHRSKITLASKCGMHGVDVKGDGKLQRVIDGRPETIKATCEAALRRLQTDVIDLYYLHRWTDRCRWKTAWARWPTWCARARFATSACQVSAQTLRRAHAVI